MKTYNWEGVNPDGYFLDKLEPIPSALPSFQKLFQVSATALSIRMEQLTKNQAVATSQEAVQNQNEPQLRDENAHNDKSVHGVLNPTYQAGLRRDAVQPDI